VPSDDSGGCRRTSAASRRSVQCGDLAETNHDAFLPLVVAAEHTTRLRLGTSVAIAFRARRWSSRR
jgi:alkanesulfonate monooxygenase SsuD/methylene tetrahydromethanopterin reductase-like flavin-dependent oxidoreductase (luciferase family)